MDYIIPPEIRKEIFSNSYNEVSITLIEYFTTTTKNYTVVSVLNIDAKILNIRKSVSYKRD